MWTSKEKRNKHIPLQYADIIKKSLRLILLMINAEIIEPNVVPRKTIDLNKPIILLCSFELLSASLLKKNVSIS